MGPGGGGAGGEGGAGAGAAGDALVCVGAVGLLAFPHANVTIETTMAATSGVNFCNVSIPGNSDLHYCGGFAEWLHRSMSFQPDQDERAYSSRVHERFILPSLDSLSKLKWP